ncbi:FadR/GntR family transcriptional regulator [Virgibacillus pantothenticus]|uniref:FadR/GntR family transcriptional regulator n=1 Tax=Virgibacillus pantothenticus TaxID=1473 RepID=UPI001BB06296|nr:FadR/GntR family transcriptional regulator [Virgibacillus pantothenticus]
MKNSLYSHVVDQLLTEIKKGTWGPGEKFLGEKELAQQFEVSRNSVREALKSLQHMGVIESFPGRGTFVTEEALRIIQNTELIQLLSNNQGSTMDLLEVRMAIEVQAADLAARKATEEEVEQLKVLVDILSEKMTNKKDYSVAGFNFHMQIAKMSKNQYIYKFFQAISKELLAQRNPEFQRTIDMKRSLQDHEKVYEAIAAGNSMLARHSMYAHFQHAMEDIKRSE